MKKLIELTLTIQAMRMVNSEHMPTREYWRKKLGIDTPLDQTHVWPEIEGGKK